MSVEGFVITALLEEGSPKKCFQTGITEQDFDEYPEEFAWIVGRYEQRKPITPRAFKVKFPEFELVSAREPLIDLIDELKNERAFIAVSGAVDEVLLDLDHENAVRKAEQLREILGDVVRLHAPASDVLIKQDWHDAYEYAKSLRALRENGEIPGIPTGIEHFDFHWGGLQDATTYVALGRPGDAKSMLLAKFAVEGAWVGERVGFFSPEMTEHQHRCRIYTMMSAKSEVQRACGLDQAFRNRALKDGIGYSLKKFRRFLEWMEDGLKGEIILRTQKFRREKMTPGFIEEQIEEFGITLAIVDPIYKLKSPRKRSVRFEELQDIVDALETISKSHGIPVVMSNQAGRHNMGSRKEAPDKDSSFGADAPAQEADVVYGTRHFSDERILKVNCSKNRHGEQFKFSCAFHPNVGVLRDVTPIKGDYYNGFDPEKAEELRQYMREIEDAPAE